MGVSYCRLRCFQEAVQCFQQALSPAAQQPPLLAKVLHNLGAALNSVGQFTPALGYHRLAAGLYGQTLHTCHTCTPVYLSHLYTCHTCHTCTPVYAGSLGCRGDQARCFSNLAFACSQLGDEEEAAESFIHALQGFRDTGNNTNCFTNVY